MEIPEFLTEMSEQLNTQGNRITADPLFEVRYKKSLVTESGYNESHFEIINEEGNSLHHSEKDSDYSELAQHLFDYHLEWCKEWSEEYNDMDIDDTLWNDSFVESFASNYDHDGWFYLPSDIKKLHMQEIEVTVNSHFTEADANAFIARKQHDYPKLYTYAISMCYCWNMVELRKWIMSLTKEDK